MSRVNGFYSPVHPDRVNPEFIGIGQKLSQHKRSRLDSDRNKQTIQSNYVFTLKLNQQLDRTLIEKQKQLERLQAARQRHHQDIKHKINEQDRRQRLLYELKQKSKQQRMNMTMGIKNAKRSLRNDRKAMKNATKQQLNGLRQLYKTQNQAFKNQQHMKYRSVEMGKKAGNQRVNEYYRSKNKQSYNNYLKMIENQDKKSQQNFNEIRYMNEHMKKLEKKIEKKQHKLREVVDQIGLYAIQCQNQRKVNFLATYSTSRPNHSSSSWRSKPTDVLRSSMNKHKMQEAF